MSQIPKKRNHFQGTGKIEPWREPLDKTFKDYGDIPILEWKKKFDSVRNKHGKIQWDLLVKQSLGLTCFKGDDSLRGNNTFFSLTNGKTPLVFGIEEGLIDVIKIQPMPNDEPVLFFAKGNENIFSFWKGKPIDRNFSSEIILDVIEIPIKLLQDPRVHFRADRSPMKEVIPILKTLGVISKTQGGDRRLANEKNLEYDVMNYCIDALLKKNRLPTTVEVEHWLDKRSPNGIPDASNIGRLLRRAIPKAESIILQFTFQKKSLSYWEA